MSGAGRLRAPAEPPACPPDVADALAECGVSHETLMRLELHIAALFRWQPVVNLVGAATMPDVWRRHVLDSAQLSAIAPRPARWLDLGAGAGFPGLVIAIVRANRDDPAVHLVEATARKCAFLAEVARQTAANVTIHNVRIEALGLAQIGLFDVVSARALAPLADLLGFALPFLTPDGRALFLKGRESAAEIDAASTRFAFQSRTVPSLTDAYGTIVEITGLRPRGG